jgi:hypothetical protein
VPSSHATIALRPAARDAAVLAPQLTVADIAGLVVVGEDLKRVRLPARLVLRSPRVISLAGDQSPPLAM